MERIEGVAVGPVDGVNYFDHQFLRKDDFEVSRRHHVNRLRQHDYVAHTPGIVAGLTVAEGRDGKHLTVSNGRGIDRLDHEVVLQPGVAPLVRVQTDRTNTVFDQSLGAELTTGYEVNLGPAVAGATYYVKIRRDEEPTEIRTDPGVVEHARLRERPVIQVDLSSTLDAGKGFLILASVSLDEGGNVDDIVVDGVRSDPAGSVIGDAAVEERNIAPGAVTETKIADDAVISQKIAEADNASAQDTNRGHGVKTGHLADDAVTDPKIATDAVKARHIAASAVGTSELEDAGVTTDKLADDGVSSAKVAEADNASGQDTNTGQGVKTGHLTDDAVTSAKIAAEQVLEQHLATGAVSTRAIAAGAVTTEEVADDAAISQKIAEADNASAQDTNIGSGVKTGHLAAEAVTFDKLEPAVRSGIATAFCAFNGVTGVLLSHHNVEKVSRESDGHYVITWREPIGAVRPLPRRRGGVELTPRLRELLRGEVADRPAATSELAGALRESIVIRREIGTIDLNGSAPRPAAAKPDAPGYFAVLSVGADRVRLGWTEAWSSDAPIAKYEVSRDGAALATVDGGGRFFTDNAVTQGKTYTYGVAGVDAFGRSSDAVTLQVTVPDLQAPTAPVLGVPAVTVAGVQLTWQASTDNVSAVTYEVLRGSLVLTRTNALSFVDDSAQAGESYAYAVVAIDAAGNRVSSGLRTVTVGDRRPPTQPAEMVADAISAAHAGVGWVASTDDTAVTRYDVFRNGGFVGSTTVPFHLDEGLAPQTAYSYEVEAVDTIGRRTRGPAVDVVTPVLGGPVFESLVERLERDRVLERGLPTIREEIVSAPLPPSDGSPPSTPSQPAVTASGGVIRVSWAPATDDVGVTGYVVYRDDQPIGHVVASPIELPPEDGPVESIRVPLLENEFLDRNPVPRALHRYSVEAFDLLGQRSGRSLSSAAVQGPDATPPTAPRHLTVNSRTPTAISIGWAASIDNDAVGFYEVRNAAGAVIATVPPSGATLQFTDTGLSPGRARSYRVFAVDVSGNRSPGSALVETTTPDIAPPSVPVGLTAVGGVVSVLLSWAASSDDVGVKEYRVFRDGVPIKTVTTPQASDDRVRSAATYSYTVAAVDAAGNMSSESEPRMVTLIDRTPPTVPKDVAAKSVTPYEARIEWLPSTDDSGVTGYEVFRDGASIGIAPGTATVKSDQTVRPGAKYAYTVRARDAEGNVSDASEPAEVTIDTEPDGDRPLGTILAYAYVPGQQRSVHVVVATPESVELQVINMQDGTPADGFVNVAAFKPTQEAGPIVSLERLAEEAPADVLGDAIGELDEGDTKVVGGVVPPSRVPDILVATPEEKVPTLAEAADPGSVRETLPRLDPERLKRLLEEASTETVIDLVRRTPPEEVADLLQPLDDRRLADLAGLSPPGVLGSLIVASESDRLAAIVDAAPPRDLADAVLRIDPAKAGAAIDTLPAQDVTGVVLALPPATRGDLIDLLSPSKLTDAAVAAPEDERAALLDAASPEALAAAVEGAPARKRATLIGAADDRQIAEAIVAADEDSRERLVEKLGAANVGGAIAAGGDVGVADVLTREQVAEAIVAAPEESRALVIAGLSDEALAETVAAAPADSQREIVASASDVQLAGAIAAAAPESRDAVVAAASDEKLASTVLAVSPQLAGSLVSSIEPERATSIISAAPTADQGALTIRLG